MRESYKIALYTDRYILLLPVRVRHVENAQTWLPTVLYNFAATNNIQTNIICQR